MRSRGERLLFAAALTVIAFLPTGVPGCGPFFDYAVFVNGVHPDYPFGPYAAGDLGVLMPTYPRSYLVVAYRNLSGVPYDAQEQKEILRLWNDRLYYACWSNEKKTWAKKWLEARKTVIGEEAAPLDIETTKEFGQYRSFVNCTEPAFKAAVEALQAKVAQYGAGSSQVKEWLAAQDTVFANCSGGESIPSPAPAGAKPEQKADRAYQIAAALFYAGRFDDAANAFTEIAKDAASPYRILAPYLTARALIRKATLMDPADEAKTAAILSQAEARLNTVLADKGSQSVHPQALTLLNLIKLDTRPDEVLPELEKNLLKPGSAGSLYQTLWDYTWLLDEREGGSPEKEGDPKPQEPPTPAKTLKPAVGDMTDWILTFQQASPESLQHALERWKKTGSPAWLAAALTKAAADTPALAEILKAAAQVPPKSPAYALATFHRARLLVLTGKVDEARKLLNEALSDKAPKLPLSAANLLISLRLQTAQSLDAFLADAPRRGTVCGSEVFGDVPTDFDCGEKPVEPPAKGPFFDTDAAAVFNADLPLDTLAAIAKDARLPKELRAQVAASAFVRAVLFERADTAAALAPVLGQLVAESAPFMQKYIQVQSQEERADYATYALLKLPGLTPYVRSGLGRTDKPDELASFRDNWWSADAAPASQSGAETIPFGYPALRKPDFVTAEMGKRASEERAALKKLGAGAPALCRRVLDWAQKRPDDPLLPEALHNAVVATKLGTYKDNDFTPVSKEVFNLLHKRYPKSEWTKKTPYYY